MNWYKKLNILQRINLKELSIDICGVHYHDLISLFGMRDTIDLLKQKLEMEGFCL